MEPALLAFGSPWEMGYFHHATAMFARVHSRANPLGLRSPDLALVGPLLWGQFRGLFFYAPILLLAPLGWLVMMSPGRRSLALLTLAISVAVFLVNLSYPEWTGGWSTGPSCRFRSMVSTWLWLARGPRSWQRDGMGCPRVQIRRGHPRPGQCGST